jgi:hypothetical protein
VMAIPWGLMGLFVPTSPRDENYYPPDRWSEFRVQMWKSKVWISQYQGIQYFQTTPDSHDPWISLAPLPSQVPIFGVYCHVTKTCETPNQDEEDCTEHINEKIFYCTRRNLMIWAINPNAIISEISETGCDLSLPVRKPEITASHILRHYSSIDG